MSKFSELGLPESLVLAVQELGFEQPTPVQEQAIPVALEAEEGMVVVAQTGTGKTAAFGLPLLARTQDSRTPTSLVLAPTRELACQIAEDFRAFAKHLPKIRIVTVYGGASIMFQMRELERGASIVVATPGRLLDLANRGAVDLGKVERLVLDEADEILRMGFQDELDAILKALPEEHCTWLYSATMPRGVLSIAQNFMKGHQRIDVARVKQDVSRMDHIVLEVPRRAKYRSLVRLVDANPDMYGIVFCRTRRDVQGLHESLLGDEITSAALHGDLAQAQRDYVMNQFRQRRVSLLIATDIAARGLDVDDISHVIHFDLPESFEAYTHRSGRTARAGKAGRSMILAEPQDRGRVRRMAFHLKLDFDVELLPNSTDVFAAQIEKLYEKLVVEKEVEGDLREAISVAMDRFEGLSREDIIRHLCVQGLAKYNKPFRRRDITEFQSDRPMRRSDRSERAPREGRATRQERPSRDERENRPAREERGGRIERPMRARQAFREERPARGEFGQGAGRAPGRSNREAGSRFDTNRRDEQSARGEARNRHDRSARGERGGRLERGARVDHMARQRATGPRDAQRTQQPANRPPQSVGGMTKITVNAGSKHGLQADTLHNLLSKNELKRSQLGKVRVDGEVASFEVHAGSADAALRAFKGFKLDGKRVSAKKGAL